jgi:hypothetical protein
MHSRLKAAPTITQSEREILGCSWVRTSLRAVTVILSVNWRIPDKQILLFFYFVAILHRLPVKFALHNADKYSICCVRALSYGMCHCI